MTLEIRDDGQTHMGAINLEGCTATELHTVAGHPAVHADVRSMARIYILSRAHRIRGAIEQATRLEAKADRLYATLPQSLRW